MVKVVDITTSNAKKLKSKTYLHMSDKINDVDRDENGRQQTYF
jgi:hypothetical protein